MVAGRAFSLPSPLIPPPRCFCGNLVSIVIACLLKGGGPISPTSIMSKVGFENNEVEKFRRGAPAVILTSSSRRPGVVEGRGFVSSLPGVKGLGGATGPSLKIGCLLGDACLFGDAVREGAWDEEVVGRESFARSLSWGSVRGRVVGKS